MYEDQDYVAREESIYAQFLLVGRVRRRPLEHRVASEAERGRSRLLSLRDALDARMAGVQDEWLDLRAQLIRQGRRPRWSGEGTMRQNVGDLAALGRRLPRRFESR